MKRGRHRPQIARRPRRVVCALTKYRSILSVVIDIQLVGDEGYAMEASLFEEVTASMSILCVKGSREVQFYLTQPSPITVYVAILPQTVIESMIKSLSIRVFYAPGHLNSG
jgi:hypothetical protein